jgi:succinate dehydrogenase / fumarate reductase cytochrome b subunit
LVLWLLAAAVGGDLFDLVNMVFGSWFGQLVLFGYTWSLFHHMLGGLKHFVWDTGALLDPAGREVIVRWQVALSIILSLGAWALFVWGRG